MRSSEPDRTTSLLYCRQRTLSLCPASTFKSCSVLLSQICGLYVCVCVCVCVISEKIIFQKSKMTILCTIWCYMYVNAVLGNYHKHSSFHHTLTDSEHTCNVAAANLYCAVHMSCHYLVVIILQAQDPTASHNPSEGVVAPPPVCLQELGNGIENKQTVNVNGFGQIQSKADLETLQLLSGLCRQYCHDLITLLLVKSNVA